MDLDWALTFLVGATAVFSSLTALKNRAWRWLAVQAVNLAALAAAWRVAPGHVALVVGPLWLLTVLAPSLATGWGDRAAKHERFGLALGLARVAALLHPNVTTKLRLLVAASQREEQAGRTEEARKALARLAAHPAGAVLAKLLELRLDRKWGELRAFVEAQPDGVLAKDGTMLAFYLRALGQLDDVEALVATYARAVGTPAFAAVEGQAMLFLAAFGGRERALDRVLGTQFAEMPDDGKRLWRLIAGHAAGLDVDAGLRELAAKARPRVATIANDRLAAPPPAPLSDEARRVLDAFEPTAAALDPTHVPRPSASVFLALLLVYVFLRELPGGTTTPANLEAMGALHTGSLGLEDAYRLATAALLHYGALHLVMNVLGLLVLGRSLEVLVGRARTVIVYVIAGIGGNALAVLWTQVTHGRGDVIVGASGAVMGVAGALFARHLLTWRARKTPVARREVVSLASMFALQIVFDNVTPLVAGKVHLFGAAIGALVAVVVGRPRVREVAEASSRSVLRARVVAFVLVAACAALLELVWSHDASSRDVATCAGGDRAACERACAAFLGEGGGAGHAANDNAGADTIALPLPRPRHVGKRERLLAMSCNHLAYSLTNDSHRAYAIYAATCDGGNMLGCTNAAVMIGVGEGVPRDPAHATAIFADICDAGHARGCVYFADDILRDGGAEAEDEARRLLEGACDAGDDVGCDSIRHLRR